MRVLLRPGRILWYCILPDLLAVAVNKTLNCTGIGEGMNFITLSSIRFYKIHINHFILNLVVLRQ